MCVSSRTTSSGNPSLKPEVAQDLGLGVVVQPTFFPGFQASFDYYKIDISGAVNSPSSQQLLTLCFQGNQSACSSITRTSKP